MFKWYLLSVYCTLLLCILLVVCDIISHQLILIQTCHFALNSTFQLVQDMLDTGDIKFPQQI